MSNLRSLNSDQTESSGATIGFRFHANAEELEEVQMAQDDLDAKNFDEIGKPKTEITTSEILDSAGSDSVKDQRNLFGKRSISVDSAYESPFSNPIETWKKLNVLKEKITKTVEEKILEMKIDRNVLSKSSRSKLSLSKDNSSISDSEDTSESSKMSDQWKNAENQVLSSDKTPSDNQEFCNPSSDFNKQDVKNVRSGADSKENENELRNRKNIHISEFINLPDIKIATAKPDTEGSLIDESLNEEVESGVEADENLNATDGLINLDTETPKLDKRDSSNPPHEESIFQKLYNSSVIFPKANIIIFIFGLSLYFCFQLPEFSKGFLFCLLMVVFWGITKSYFQIDDFSQQQRPFVFQHYGLKCPLEIPKSAPTKGIWFNEYEEEVYEPEYYSVTKTVPAYLELEESILMVSRPKGKISRRATFDEPEYKFPILSKRVYNISGCGVFLLPDGLTKKRLFSKKYPIVIFLKPDSLLSEKKKGKEIEDETHENEGEKTPEEQAFLLNSDSPKSKGTLYLFARCDRQKEEWYRRLLSASRLSQKSEKTVGVVADTDKEAEKPAQDESPKDPSTPFENLFFDNEEAYLEEYFTYMSNFVQEVPLENKFLPSFSSTSKDIPVSKEYLSRLFFKRAHSNSGGKQSSRHSENSSKSEIKESDDVSFSTDQVMWFNAVVNRILFDVFRSPHWHSKIQEKVYRKLNSVRLPYYIEDIEVVELDLGKTGPMFHRVSQPFIDERGLWFDMELSFDGLIRLTIQTHLNLNKLQKGMEESEETSSQPNEKLNKKKKSQKTEKETVLVKESKGITTKPEERKNKIPQKTPRIPVIKEETKVPDSDDSDIDSNLDSQVSEDLAKELIHEIADLAEITLKKRLSHEKKRSPLYDSDVEDSAESSDEDEEEEEPPQIPVSEEPCSEQSSKRYPKNRRSSQKLFKVFENVAQSKYFRSVAQSRYIQKAIAGVSAAKLRLALEIKSCAGVLVINIPPPPSDRFWYGFREMPKLVFSANPKIGDKAVRFVHIRNYFQKKILHELKEVVVLPNMLNKVCPLLSRNEKVA